MYICLLCLPFSLPFFSANETGGSIDAVNGLPVYALDRHGLYRDGHADLYCFGHDHLKENDGGAEEIDRAGEVSAIENGHAVMIDARLRLYPDHAVKSSQATVNRPLQ